MGGEDIELLPVFRDGASGDLDALFLQRLGDRVVGKGSRGIFLVDELLDRFPDTRVGNLRSTLRLIAGGLERAHFHEALRGENVFPRDRSGHGGGVELELVRDLVHGQRAQVAGPFFQEGRLLLDEFVGDRENGFLA